MDTILELIDSLNSKKTPNGLLLRCRGEACEGGQPSRERSYIKKNDKDEYKEPEQENEIEVTRKALVSDVVVAAETNANLWGFESKVLVLYTTFTGKNL